jgi:hypothetical protein
MPSQERDRSCICVLGVLILPPFTIFLLDFGIDPTVWYFCISALPALTYNRAESVIIKNAMILTIIHNIFNLRDTQVRICTILVLLMRADVLNHYLNIRH